MNLKIKFSCKNVSSLLNGFIENKNDFLGLVFVLPVESHVKSEYPPNLLFVFEVISLKSDYFCFLFYHHHHHRSNINKNKL